VKLRRGPGALDPGFGEAGVITSNPARSPYPEEATCLVVDSDLLYVAGTDLRPGNAQWRIEKRRARDGSLVTDFGESGVVASNPSARDDTPVRLAVKGESFFIAGDDGGGISGPLPCEFDGLVKYPSWRIEKRRRADGSVDRSFGVLGGWTGIVSNELTCQDFAMDDASLYFLASYIHHTDSWYRQPHWQAVQQQFLDREWRIDKRQATSADPAHGFGKEGSVRCAVGSGPSEFAAIIVHDRHLYIAGTEIHRIWVTGDDGKKATRPLESRWHLGRLPGFELGIVVDSSHLYVAAYETSPGWIQRRSSTTGALDTAFGKSGTETGEDGTRYRGMALDSTHIYLVGGEKAGASDTRWRIEKRYR
jgi:hypothetical protein